MAIKSKTPTANLSSLEIFLQKRNKFFVEEVGNEDNKNIALTFNRNIEQFGFCLDQNAFETISKCSEQQISEIYYKIVPVLKRMVGDHRTFRPFYPNFPKQVMEASDAELYFNALAHYWGSFVADVTANKNYVLLPHFDKEDRPALDENVRLKPLSIGTKEEFEKIFTQLVGSNSSLSETDKEIVKWFIQKKPNVFDLLPATIPQKENLCLVVGLLLDSGNSELLFKYLKTATDVLRVAVVMSGGDVSLAESVKFRNFSRKERRFLLGALENCGSIVEDMLRWKERWKRLGERLHPGEYHQLHNTNSAFNIIRNDAPYSTFASQVEKALKSLKITEAIDLLEQRPGVFARRLDHILRLTNNNQYAHLTHDVVERFLKVADKVSTPVLLQCFNHFWYRNAERIRTFFPKGNVAKLQVCNKPLPEIDSWVTKALATRIRLTLVNRFKNLPSLGKCWIDNELRTQMVPFAQRSASKALRSIARGSRISLPDANVLRFFLWWTDGKDRTDIDLSAVCFTEDWSRRMDLSFYNLREAGCYHSGDITGAPKGACEFIDVSVDSLLRLNYRYVLMCLNSYTTQPYCDLPECFAGWMGRQSPNSGEVFEPKTVVDKIDLTANSTVAVPIIFDLRDQKAIWTDLSLTSRSMFNTVFENSKNLAQLGKAITELNKPNLFDLFSMHMEARGKQVSDKDDAQTVFGLYEGITPFDTDKILSEFLG